MRWEMKQENGEDRHPMLPLGSAALPWESKAEPEIPGISQLPIAWLLPFREESLLF